MEHLIDDNEVLEREKDMARLRHAHALIATDFTQARAELEDLASRGSVMAMLYLAHEYSRRAAADHATAEKLYRTAYEHHSSSALQHLASMKYQRGDLIGAEALWREGVAKSDGRSMASLAAMYLRHPTMERFDQVKDLLRQSRALGRSHAKHRLGMMFMKGRYGVTRVPRGALLALASLWSSFWAARQYPRWRNWSR